ncbi:hypothetical protein F3Y22_tig00011079pilonHSYRG00076 [Hibiscus syriacus]|uniref:Protein kinase domain-containing protein n=1 Tax=Hibiscus syriacus TaxID=106335 RepID=A0A6A3C9V4_HIBSY|nr:probable inactive receptor kinase At2g26730 [Hibiscus syriacus]KAE8723962.1 hypothetical protein F3Y22_tig00011079pilonHSYRG00076 [Hibiscus syriacus]
MNRVLIRVLPLLMFLLFHVSNSENEEVKQSLVRFMDQLAAENVKRDQSWGWNMTSDPCKDKWKGVSCDLRLQSVKKVVLDELNLTGVLDIGSICKASSLFVFSLVKNDVVGLISGEIGNCKRLTHLYLNGNKLSGHLPDSLTQLSSLKRFDISNNNFSGKVPDLSRISGLLTFLVQNNQLSGEIPKLDFSNLMQFNVSNNNFSGPLPDVKGRFSAESWSGNPQLCGESISKACPSTSPSSPSTPRSNDSSRKLFLIYSGYAVLGLIILLVVAFILVGERKPREDKTDVAGKGVYAYASSIYDESKITVHKSEYSASSDESRVTMSPLVVLRSPTALALRFEDLLRAPAELLGKGKHGSLYKVTLDNGATTLAVKRIKDWRVTSRDFKRRMQRLHRARHPNILPSVAYYSSNQEKLVVYEYQPNGSLSRLIQGPENVEAFEWGSRLNVAATLAEALAYMHEELREDGIAHGNLKSTNILFNNNMDPCITEYGLMVLDSKDPSSNNSQSNSFENNDSDPAQVFRSFKADIYGFGVILLELVTGKLVTNNGFELVQWVNSVVREEWTVEVFERGLILDGASEERLMILLQIALKCVNPNPYERPDINQVALVINALKDEEDKSSFYQ